jgi:hypothetical protein
MQATGLATMQRKILASFRNFFHKNHVLTAAERNKRLIIWKITAENSYATATLASRKL